MVADLRAPTPSAAAELVAPNLDDLHNQINHHQIQLERSINNQLNQIWQKVDHLFDRHALQNPQKKLDRQKEKSESRRSEKIFGDLRLDILDWQIQA